ncbi:MAG: sulfite exporter TauE/SafE family protein [Candidatus Lokiarchaeota archaeon]|nr:sulfite exporter TauE/SafE family protein [Candidatus Lokiarchaeota archaeon]
MINQIIWDPLFLTVLFSALALGILHTILPCEDKAIFLFWSLGISKSPKKSVLILVLYGLGLISANLIIAMFSIMITNIPLALLNFTPDPHAFNLFGAISSLIAATFLLLLIYRGTYIPHAHQTNGQLPHKFNWSSLKTPFIFGNLAGFAPCIFEFFIYSKAIELSISRHFLGGIAYVLFFSIGTFIGLFPLALAKLGTSQIIKRKKDSKYRITYAMTSLIILFNVIIIILSLMNIILVIPQT